MRSESPDDYITYHRKAWDREYARRAQLAAQSQNVPASSGSRREWRQAAARFLWALGYPFAWLVIAPLWLAIAAIYLAIVFGGLFLILAILHALWRVS